MCSGQSPALGRGGGREGAGRTGEKRTPNTFDQVDVAPSAGFEPATRGLGNRCSIP
jgi:hypothetical protein